MSNYSIEKLLDAPAVDLPAGVETDLLGASGIDAAQCDTLVIEVENDNGASPIDVLTLYEKAPRATKWTKSTATIAAVAASDSTIITLSQHSHGRVRLTATPVAHVSADVHATNVRKNV